MTSYLTLSLVCLVLPTCIISFSPPDSSAVLLAGQAQYQELAVKASLPRYGPCWMSALSQLSSTCNQLTDTTQARLALSFANCFLVQAGQREYPCSQDQEVATCLQQVDNNAFTAYSNFYTHTQNMCYFIKSQEWQEMTDNTISRLSSSSAKVATEMEESHNLQKVIALGQRESLQYQKQLAENGSFLSHAIESSKENVKHMLEEFRLSTNEQKNLIFKVFDRVSRLQNMVVSEVSWLYTVVFYSACLLIIYLVTATKRTADSRLWLFLILSVNFGLERLVIWWSLPADGSNAMTNISQVLSQRIWMVRNMAIFISIVVLTLKAMKFKDINIINNYLLEEIKRQNLELKKSMENFQVVNKMSGHIQNLNVDTLDGNFRSVSRLLEEDTGYQGNEEDLSDDESGSFNSTRTDFTFEPNHIDESLSTFSTGSRSRETTPTNNSIMPLEALTSSLVHSTPAKKSKSDEERTPSPIISNEPRYNLRSRNTTSSNLNKSLEETPETFAKHVREQLTRTKRNYRKWKMAVERQNLDFSE